MRLTSVKLHFIWGVLEAVPGYEHLAVHILGALADVGGQGEEEPYHVEAQLVSGAEGETAHHRDEAELHINTRHLT